MSLEIRPLTLKQANAYVALHHRHNKAIRNGYKFAVGCCECDGGGTPYEKMEE